MKHVLIFFVVFFCLIFVGGCEKTKTTKHWHFIYDVSEIEEIRIVKSNDAYNTYDRFDVLGYIDVSKAQDLYMDIEKLEFDSWFIGSPGSPSGFCILFIYKNGEADLISCYESLRYRFSKDMEIEAHFSWLATEKENIYRLIFKYLAN